MSKQTKAGFRWKRVAKFVVHIEQSATARMWRAVTSRETSEPMPLEKLGNAVWVKLGTGHKYRGLVTIKRIRDGTRPRDCLNIVSTFEDDDDFELSSNKK